jgi:class 3 adenylate cyclase/tetratricopeptide (TPR) repeat protein
VSGTAVTVLFTDMEGSTEFTSARGDEATMVLLRDHETVVREAARRHDGRVVKSTGDGFMVVFPSTAGGVAAALDIRRRHEDDNAGRPETPLKVRMGLHVGPAIEHDGELYGLAINTAARVAAKARSGQVLVSEAVLAGASGDGDWTFVDRGLFWLKGLRERWRLHEVTVGKVVEAAHALEGQTPFVNRDDERALLRRYLDGASEGRGGLVVVLGSAGNGKTRLVQEVGAEALGRGLRFVVGQSYVTSTRDPYTPLVEVLEGIERQLGHQAFRDVLGTSAGQVARLLPELLSRYPDIPPPAHAVTSDERRLLFGAVREVFSRLAAVRPVMILLDDLQWTDEPSLLLFEHLASDLADLPILVVATYTDEDVSAARPLHAVLTRLHRQHLVRSVPVGTLREADVDRLLAAVGGSGPPRTLVSSVYQVTAGNPLFLEQLIHHLLEQGSLFDDDGRWRKDVGGSELDVPESVRFIIESRLQQLNPATRGTLATASLIGRDFGFDLLELLSTLSEDDLLDAVDEAEHARLITSTVDAGAVRLSFAHELVRRTLVDELSLSRRQRLHLRVADAIEQVETSPLTERAGVIAYHLQRAGRLADPARLVHHLVLAGERALAATAYDEALGHLGQALALTPDDDIAARARVLEGMAMAERSLGHLDEALALWRKALDAHEALGDLPSVARLCLDAAVQVAWWRRGREVVELVDRGLSAAGDGRSAQRAGLLALGGQMASQTGAYARGEELLDEALAIAREHDDERVLGLTLYSRAVHHFGHCQHAETVTVGLASVKHLRAAPDLWDLANVLGYVGASLGWLGRFEEAATIGMEGEELARRLGNWSAYVFAEQAQGFREVGSNPAAEVLERRGRHALELGRDMGFPWLSSVAHTRIGLASFWRGQWEEALSHFEEAADLEIRGAAGGQHGRLFLIHAYLGNRSTALELVDRARGGFPVPGRPNSATSWALAATAVEAFTVLGEEHEAAALYDTVLALAATGDVMRSWDFRLVATIAGMAAACAREWDRAERHFQEALRLARALPLRLEVPEAHRFQASMLLARNDAGDARRAKALLAEAGKAYAGLGMPRHEATVRALGREVDAAW